MVCVSVIELQCESSPGEAMELEADTGEAS